MDDTSKAEPSDIADVQSGSPVRVLLLDDDSANLLLRSAILRQHGYEALTAGSAAECYGLLDRIDVAVLDYHLGHGRFGTEVAVDLRKRHPTVPIIILSATLEQRFGGVEDMHLLKGYSSIDDLLTALRGLSARQRGKSVVIDAREFYYSRIAMAIGADVLIQIVDPQGNWRFVNELAAEFLGHPKDWFVGRNLFAELGADVHAWKDVLLTVAETRETFVDRTPRGLLPGANARSGETWSVIAFPLMLHDGSSGIVLSARVLDGKAAFA